MINQEEIEAAIADYFTKKIKRNNNKTAQN